MRESYAVGCLTITTLPAGARTITKDAPGGIWNGSLNGWGAPATPGIFTGPDCAGGNVTLVNGQAKMCFVLNVANYWTPVFSPSAASSTSHALQQSQPVQPPAAVDASANTAKKVMQTRGTPHSGCASIARTASYDFA